MASTLATPVAQAISLLFDGNLGRLLNYGLRPGYGLLGAWSPISLFMSNEQGVWYDPSDFSTLFQDSAGTTPVTAVEQPVGLILDKSGRGNHATQATSASRPTLSARVNLLTYSEDFSNAAWSKQRVRAFGSGSVVNAIANPIDGAVTADLVTEDTATGAKYLVQTTLTVGQPYTRFIYAKTNGRSIALCEAGAPVAKFNLATGVVISGSGAAINAVGNGWYLCKCSAVAGYTNAGINITQNDGTDAYTGDGTSGVYIWGAQLETGSTATRYQSITTATSYDTVGFPYYLKFDGVDDSLSTASIDFTSTDKMTVVAGVRKLSDAATGMIISTSTAAGGFELYTPGTAGQTGYYYANKGTGNEGSSYSGTTSGIGSSPISLVMTGKSNLAQTAVGSEVNLRVNNVSYPSAGTQSSGTFGNYPLYVGSRGGTTLPFNGHLYSLIVRGAQSTDSQIVSAESYVNSKTGAY